MSFLETLRSRLISELRQRSMLTMVRAACWVALVGLAVMVASILNPMPLTVIFAMSLGQVIGIAAFLCYLLSILMDVVRGRQHSPEEPGPPRGTGAAAPATPRDST